MHDHSFISRIAAADTFQISTDACNDIFYMCLLDPSYYWPLCDLSLRKNLRSLVDKANKEYDNNVPRTFWRWLRDQPWRRMLPEPVEYLGFECLDLKLLNVSRKVCVIYAGNRG